MQQDAGQQDPKEMFRMIFGADAFLDYFGDVEILSFLMTVMQAEEQAEGMSFPPFLSLHLSLLSGLKLWKVTF